MSGEREAERDRLREDAVAAPHHRSLRACSRARARQRGQHPVAARHQQVGRVSQQDRERRVEDVARRHPAVQPPGFEADELLDVRQEGDDVMLGRPLDLVDAGRIDDDVLAADAGGRSARHEPRILHALASGELDVQPDGESMSG
jgi:hypothetical protein